MAGALSPPKRALRDSRTDVEALDLTADRLRHLQDAFTKAADDSRTRATRYTEQWEFCSMFQAMRPPSR